MRRKPFGAILLIFILIFQSISAFYGGIAFIIKPGGELLHMPVTALKHSPFHDFLVPGIILLLMLGVFPAFAAYCLIARPKKKWMDSLNLYHDRHCGWTYSLYIGLMLIIWITVQVAMIGYGDVIQTVYAGIGILITAVTLLPAVMNYYVKNKEPETGKWRTL